MSSWLQKKDFLLILILGMLLITLILVGVTSLPKPLAALRLLLGFLFVLLIPGYMLQEALFPGPDRLDWPERLALSFVLSLAVIPPIALLLDRLPWGISLWPVLFTEGLLIAVCSIIVWWQRRSMPPHAPITYHPISDFKKWWTEQDRINRFLYGLIAASLLMAALAAIFMIILPKPGDHFTEFYILGPDGLAENFPREVSQGDPISLTIGLTNRERYERTYRVEIWAVQTWQDDLRVSVGESTPILLTEGENIEWPMNWSMPWSGDNQLVEFLLFVDEETEPYRQLRLFLNVK